MAEIPIDVDLNVGTNKIKDARIPEPSGAKHDEDAINRKFVEDGKKYITPLSEDVGLVVVSDVGGVKKGTTSADVNDKTTNEILDKMLFPLESPSYVLPTATVEITNLSDIVKDGQFQSDIVFEVTAIQNDSNSIISYTFDGDGFVSAVTQASNIFTLSDYVTNGGLNSWTVTVNYDDAVQKQDSHGNDDNVGKFSANVLVVNLELNTPNPIIHSVDYNLTDTTTKNATEIMDFMDSIESYKDVFYIEVGNAKRSAISFGIPQSNADVKITIDDEEITNAFKSSNLTSVKPWGVGNGIDYTIFSMDTETVYTEPKVIKVEVFKKYYTKIVDVVWYSDINKLELDNDGVQLDAWDINGNASIPANGLSIVRDGTDIRFVSDLGIIMKIEKGKPHTQYIFEDVDVKIADGIGRVQHLVLTNNYKFKVWLRDGLTPTFSTKVPKQN